MSLSTIINDLEAEGAKRILSTTFVTSKGIPQKSRTKFLKDLFGCSTTTTTDADSLDEEEEEGVEDGVTTAFGTKFGDEVEEEDEMDEDTSTGHSVGIVVASPFADASVNEVASTVVACGGNIVYVTCVDDLARDEGILDTLAPALESIINYSEDEEGVCQTTLVIVVDGVSTPQELQEAKEALENSISTLFSSIVQPNPLHPITSLDDIFSHIDVRSTSDPNVNLLELLGTNLGTTIEPSSAMNNVAKSSELFLSSSSSGKITSALSNSSKDVAAARKLYPLSRQALQSCLAAVSQGMEGVEDSGGVNYKFGNLCDSAIQLALTEFDAKAGSSTLTSSTTIAKHIRSTLIEEMVGELETLYDAQLENLYAVSMESFRSSLSSLRLSPNLATDMDEVVTKEVSSFLTLSKGLRPKKLPSSSSSSTWQNPSTMANQFKNELKEYVAFRLLVATADGKFKPKPRSGVTLGFHWLLPKPFGNDYRMEPHQVHVKDDLIYIPKSKVADVSEDGVSTGDWRRSVVPSPTGNEMTYMK